MSFAGFARRPLRAASAAPIKGYSHRGFLIGWLAIIALAAGSYAFASSQLSPSSAQLRLASIGSETYPVLTRP